MAEKKAKKTSSTSAKQTQTKMQTKSAAGKEPKGKQRKAPNFGPIDAQLGPKLREELELVAKSEAAIMKGLSNKDINRQFLVDPAGALNKIGVELPPIIKKRLKTRPELPDLMGPQAFRLPNGQVVTANVNVRFTARKED